MVPLGRGSRRAGEETSRTPAHVALPGRQWCRTVAPQNAQSCAPSAPPPQPPAFPRHPEVRDGGASKHMQSSGARPLRGPGQGASNRCVARASAYQQVVDLKQRERHGYQGVAMGLRVQVKHAEVPRVHLRGTRGAAWSAGAAKTPKAPGNGDGPRACLLPPRTHAPPLPAPTPAAKDAHLVTHCSAPRRSLA